jgi:hypothetical protein
MELLRYIWEHIFQLIFTWCPIYALTLFPAMKVNYAVIQSHLLLLNFYHFVFLKMEKVTANNFVNQAVELVHQIMIFVFNAKIIIIDCKIVLAKCSCH